MLTYAHVEVKCSFLRFLLQRFRNGPAGSIGLQAMSSCAKLVQAHTSVHQTLGIPLQHATSETKIKKQKRLCLADPYTQRDKQLS